jgi:hypothetical protein
MSLEHGFLFMYDWVPMLEDLEGNDLKELLLALIDRQRNGAPKPRFSHPKSDLYYQVIAFTIDRRRMGQKGGQTTQKRKTGSK